MIDNRSNAIWQPFIYKRDFSIDIISFTFTEMQFFRFVIFLTAIQALEIRTPFSSVVLDFVAQERNAIREMQEMDQLLVFFILHIQIIRILEKDIISRNRGLFPTVIKKWERHQ